MKPAWLVAGAYRADAVRPKRTESTPRKAAVRVRDARALFASVRKTTATRSDERVVSRRRVGQDRAPMRNVVFCVPFFRETSLRFVRGIAALPGVRLGLVTQDHRSALPQELSRTLASHWQVKDG